MTTYIVHTILVYWIIVTLSHHFMALPVNLECCRPCHLLQNYQITQPVFVGGCWVLADVCTGSHSALKCMLNNKKISTTWWQKKSMPQFTQHFCIKGVQYYCSSTKFFFHFSLLCRREFNNILVFLFVCTTIWLTQIIWYDHQIDTSLNKCIAECN